MLFTKTSLNRKFTVIAFICKLLVMINLPSLQICCVKPVPYQDESLLPMEGYERPEKIRKFHMVNNIDKFQYDRPYHKGNKDRDNEFKVRAQWSQIEIKVAFEFSYTFIY